MTLTLTNAETDALIAEYLEPHGDPCKRDRGEWWLKERGVPVRAIIGYWQGGVEGDLAVDRRQITASRSPLWKRQSLPMSGTLPW